MSHTTIETDLQAVADAIRSNDRFIVVAHENPDGDALGSMLATVLGLEALGKDVVMYLSGAAPTPGEYSFLDLSQLDRELPADLGERVLIAVDCANERRIGPEPTPVEGAKLVVNVDHHHDNSAFGALNLIVPDASSTAEIVRDLLRELDVPPTPGASSTRTRRRSRYGWPQSWWRPAPMCTASSGTSTRRCSSPS